MILKFSLLIFPLLFLERSQFLDFMICSIHYPLYWGTTLLAFLKKLSALFVLQAYLLAFAVHLIT